MKTLFKTLLLSAVFTLAAVAGASAQFESLNDNMGRPLRAVIHTDVNGTPYLFDDWVKGTVTINKGTQFVGVDLKYDIVSDELIFKSEKGESQTFVEPVREFTLKTEKGNLHVFRNGFVPVDDAKPISFYEVLVDEKTALLKRSSKSIQEEVSYSSATKVKNFQPATAYYLAKDSKLTKIKNDKKSVLAALPEKSTQLEAYIKAQKLDLKNDSHLVKLIAYYNTL